MGALSRRRLIGASGERPDDAVARFPELQHSSKRVDEGIDPMTSFRIETESDSAVADAIDVWVRGTD